MDLDDYNTLEFAFIGGEGRPIEKDLCPIDKLFLNYNVEISRLPNGGAKETYEIFRINKMTLEIENECEELARNKMKIIIKALNNLKKHYENESERFTDYKMVLIGQKYTA